MTPVQTILIFKFALVFAVSAAVITEDVRYREVPNSLCAVLLIIGMLSAGLCRGWIGIADASAGATLGFVVFLVPYGLGGMGGGDVKLMAGCGALTGFQGILPALILVSAAGALSCVAYILYQRSRRRAVAAAVPYAPAIVTGSLLVAISQVGAS